MRDRLSRYLERPGPHPPDGDGTRPRAPRVVRVGLPQIPEGVRKPLWSVVLILMIGLTGWAVSTVSIWLVPAYLGIMLLLLGSPQENRPEGSPTVAGSESGAVGAPRAVAPRPQSRAGGKAGESGSATEPDRPEVSGDASGSAQGGSKAAKPRASRGRPRKSAAKAASAAPPTPAPATWIRIGPGKFVRADVDPSALVDAPAANAGDGPVDPDVGTPSPSPTESQQVPEFEADPGCQGIAPSALGSLAIEEPATIPVPTAYADPASPTIFPPEDRIDALADMAASVPADPDADVEPPAHPDVEVGEVLEVDPDVEALVREDFDFEAVPESLGDDRSDDDFAGTEVAPCDDLLPDRPTPAEDPCAPGAAEPEPAPDEEFWEEEQSPPEPESAPEPVLESRHVPSQRITPSGPMSSRHWPRRVVRNRDAVDIARRSRAGVPGPGPRDRSPASRTRLRDASHHASGGRRRIRRDYRPRSPPFRYDCGFPDSNRMA